MSSFIRGLLDRALGRCAFDRRKKKSFVVVERRHRVTQKLASDRMYASIDNFSASVERIRARAASE